MSKINEENNSVYRPITVKNVLSINTDFGLMKRFRDKQLSARFCTISTKVGYQKFNLNAH